MCVSINRVSKTFGDFVAVDDVSLDIKPGEFFSLLGPSGCGKTTLLRILGGFELPSSGEVYLDKANITNSPPNLRPISRATHYSRISILKRTSAMASGRFPRPRMKSGGLSSDLSRWSD